MISGARRRTLARPLVLALVAVLACAGAVTAAAPARACACGALVSNDPRLSVSGETSVVRWGGGREEIVMSMAVASSRKDAALLLPTPAPATVRLGRAAWMEMLGRISAPVPDDVAADWWPSRLFDPGPMVGAGAVPHKPDVRVDGEANVGPYHVASLSARDPGALTRWLRANGYRLKGAVAKGLKPYVAKGWHYTAVRLRSTGSALRGALSPLRVRFAAPAPVYPMRLSRAITADQSVRLYVLAPHRMRPVSGGVPFSTSYAGRVTHPDAYGAGFRTLLGDGTTYLTTLDGMAKPGAVTDDIGFARVPDTAFTRTTRVERPVYIAGVAGGPLLVFLGFAAVLVVGGMITAIALTRRRRAA